jgi:hypothetical protein
MIKLILIIIVALSSCGIMEPHQYNCDSEIASFVQLHGEPESVYSYEKEERGYFSYTYYYYTKGFSRNFVSSDYDDHCVTTDNTFPAH